MRDVLKKAGVQTDFVRLQITLQNFSNNSRDRASLWMKLIRDRDLADISMAALIAFKNQTFANRPDGILFREKEKGPKKDYTQWGKTVVQRVVKKQVQKYLELILPDGRALGDISWNELELVQKEYEQLSILISKIRRFARVSDPSLKVRDVISERQIRAVLI